MNLSFHYLDDAVAVSQGYTRPIVPKKSRAPLVAISLFVALVLVTIVAFALPASVPAVLYERFAVWSNVFFLWPTLVAFNVGAHALASALAITYVASVFHHGCNYSPPVRLALAVDCYVLVALGLAALAVGVARSRDPLRWPSAVALGLGALTAAAVGVPLAASGMLDGCLYVHEAGSLVYEASIADALVHVWCVIDDVTASAALVAALVYYSREPLLHDFGHIWSLAMLALVLYAFQAYVALSDVLVYGVLVGAIVLVLAARLAVACASQRRRFGALETLGAALVGGTGLAIFLTHNTAGFHGVWHALEAVAMLLLLTATITRVDEDAI
jgi:hypothetical protein